MTADFIDGGSEFAGATLHAQRCEKADPSRCREPIERSLNDARLVTFAFQFGEWLAGCDDDEPGILSSKLDQRTFQIRVLQSSTMHMAHLLEWFDAVEDYESTLRPCAGYQLARHLDAIDMLAGLGRLVASEEGERF